MRRLVRTIRRSREAKRLLIQERAKIGQSQSD
jgi:hypothetical protein